MTSLLLAALRLGGVVALLIGLPGWIASGLPLRPFRLLHVALLGVGVHVTALVLTSFATGTVSLALWILPVLTFVVALAARAVGRKLGGAAADVPPALDGRGSLALGAVVLIAALLRWFHNYHFDDLQHLFYLTEISREDTLFPSQFLLRLSRAHVPGLGDGRLMLSRYPYWAASNVVLSRLARVSAGDAYILIGLGVLALTLGQMATLASKAWSNSAGTLWMLGVVAISSFVNDNLLNFGGYPFQSGKLFVLLSATAAAAAWRTSNPAYLISAAIGLFVGPLLHTNNAVAGACVAVLLLPLLFRESTRRAALATLGVGLVLGVVALGSIATHGFFRWQPMSIAAERAAVEEARAARVAADDDNGTADRPAASDSREGGRTDRVARRLLLFVSRGLPLEVLPLLIVAAVLPLFANVSAVAKVAPLSFALFSLMILTVSGGELGRQLVTSALKPGYFVQRAALLRIAGAIEPNRPLLTDPITGVFGRAVGWRVPGVPQLGEEEQAALMLLHHPAVTGEALANLLSSEWPATLVINEQVAGAGISRKFERLPNLNVTARSSPSVVAAAEARSSVSETIRDVYELDLRDLTDNGPTRVRAVLDTLLARPIVVFAQERETAHVPPVPMTTYGALLRGGTVPEVAETQPFLSSALVTLPPVRGCADRVQMTIRNEASFHAQVLAWPLDPVPKRGVRPYVRRTLPAGAERSLGFGFDPPLCDAGPLTLLLHSGYWWDFRFDVVAPTRKAAAPIE